MDYAQTYADFLKSRFRLQKPLKVVCDSSNGTTGIILEKLRDIPNLTIALINEQPDPDFPAHGPNPLHPGATDQLSEKVLKEKADVGVAFDADGDRAFFVDNTGVLLPSYITATLLYKNAQPPYVCDELVYQSLRFLNIFPEQDLAPSKVGSFFVKDVLKKTGGEVGAEFSGHYYFKDFFGVDSGIFAMIEVLNILSQLNATLSDFKKTVPPMVLINDDVQLARKAWPDIKAAVINAVSSLSPELHERDGLSIILPDKWVSLRTSNTEPLVRIVAGAGSEKEARQLIQAIKALAE